MDVLSQHFTKSKLLKYTLPTMAMMLVSSAYGIIDGLFVSNLVGKDALASMTIVLPFIVIVSALGIMMGSGGSAVVGQLLGAGDRKGANRAFSLIAWATFVTGVVCSVLGMAFMDEAVVLLGASAEMAPMAAAYGKIVFLCLPMFMITYVFEMFCSVAGKPGFGFCHRLPRAWSTSAWMPCSWACSAWGSRALPRQPALPSIRRQCSWSSCSHGARSAF